MDNKPYHLLARYYDELLPGTSEMNRHAREKILGAELDGLRVVCDLACGSGATALGMARQGKRVYAVDNSSEFCRSVRQQARKQRLAVRVVRADMRNFQLPEPVDLVTCEFSALNNLSRHADITKVFGAVQRALRPGGYLLFDVNTLQSHKEQVAATNWFESRRFFLMMRGTRVEEDGRRVRLDLDWFLPRGRLWSHRREVIFNIAWSDEELRAALRRARFGTVRVWDGMDVRPPIPGGGRGFDMYYLTRKRA